MGRVYRARDTRLNRPVALKFLRQEDPQQVERFLQEARLQAQLDHPGIGRVYEVGEYDGHPYIAMQFIEGLALDEAARQMTLPQKVEVMIQVVDAIGAAHRLGLIHRDIKPANILVEKTENCQFRPFVVDFGLAREVDSRGPTVSGTIMGSPAYMAPEQARGQIHLLDRRTDVYGLGATFYHLLTGTAPFEGSHPVQIIMKVMEKDPLPPRKIEPSLPADLETIVLKCMEKDQARRYLSTGALREDLRRYQDGEPVLARRAGITYRLGKLVRRHRLTFSILVAASLAVLTLGALWLHASWEGREQARLAQAFGQEIEEIEHIMARAHLLPLHDIRQEKSLVRQRLDRLEKQIREMGRPGRGPGYYALGRGYLSLANHEQAARCLENAWQAGYRPPEVAYASGLTWIALYQKALLEVSRIRNPELARARREEIDKIHRPRALQYLGRAKGTAGESPEYLQCLLDYLEQKYEKCLGGLDRILTADPWHDQALHLRGEILLARARLAVDQGDNTGARESLRLANEANRRAAEIARSNPAHYTGEAKCRFYGLLLDLQTGASPDEAIREAGTACSQALTADPDYALAYYQQVLILSAQADHLLRTGQDPLPGLNRALAAATRLERLNPGDPAAWQLQGFIRWRQGQTELNRGQNPEANLTAASQAFQRSLSGDPYNTATRNDLGITHALLGLWKSGHGQDPRSDLQKAAGQYRLVLEREPGLTNTLLNLSTACLIQADYEKKRGLDYRPLLDQAANALERAIAIKPGAFLLLKNLGEVLEMAAEYEHDHGLDPRPKYQQAVEKLERSIELNPENHTTFLVLGIARARLAEFELSAGRDPGPAFRAGENAYQAAIRLNPADSLARNNLGNLYISEGLHRLSRGADPGPLLDQADGLLNQALRLSPDDPYIINTLAHVWLVRAEARLQTGEDPRPACRQARKILDRALEIDPHYDFAHFNLGLGHRLLAEYNWRSGRDPLPDLRTALQHFDRAIYENKEYSPSYLERARIRLLAARYRQQTGRGGDGGEREAARRDLQEAGRLNPLTAEVNLLQGELAGLSASAAGQPAPAGERLLQEGLHEIEIALAKNPRLARAWLIKAWLLSGRSRSAAGETSRRQLQEESRAASSRAFQLNPGLRHEAAAPGWTGLNGTGNPPAADD